MFNNDSKDYAKGSAIRNHPEKNKSLLDEFQMIVVDEFLKGISLVRSISHQIYLIPGSSLPNKAHYRMTPIEKEEVNKKVYELLDRGLIREILS